MENRVVELARGWVGTRFHHQGRLKNIGVDCIGLVVGVAREMGMDVVDRLDYGRAPHNGELEAALGQYLRPCGLKIGAVALFKISKEPQHVGIITRLENGDWGLVHAYAQARKVVEHNLDDWWQKRMVAVFEF